MDFIYTLLKRPGCSHLTHSIARVLERPSDKWRSCSEALYSRKP